MKVTKEDFLLVALMGLMLGAVSFFFSQLFGAEESLNFFFTSWVVCSALGLAILRIDIE